MSEKSKESLGLPKILIDTVLIDHVKSEDCTFGLGGTAILRTENHPQIGTIYLASTRGPGWNHEYTDYVFYQGIPEVRIMLSGNGREEKLRHFVELAEILISSFIEFDSIPRSAKHYVSDYDSVDPEIIKMRARNCPDDISIILKNPRELLAAMEATGLGEAIDPEEVLRLQTDIENRHAAYCDEINDMGHEEAEQVLQTFVQRYDSEPADKIPRTR